ncbi:MAG: CHAD domain-containing protein [Thiotrichaceae bacterium]|nr:CHAD domain-containing protein [Thiotrichaceae bacterium]
MPIETELKLQLVNTPVSQFLAHPALQQATVTHLPQRLYNTYYDTPHRDLAQQRIGVRIRRIGEEYIQTVKTGGKNVGGLQQRNEWEISIAADQLDLEHLKQVLPEEAQAFISELSPMFTTDFTRRIWDIWIAGEHHIELALDEGEIRSGQASMSLQEIELELKQGSPSKIYQFALYLQETLPLVIEQRSKAERGNQLYTGNFTANSYKASPLELYKHHSVEEAFIEIMQHNLAHLQANEAAALQGEDIEGVHQMRVALRRMRSCLSLFAEVIPKTSNGELRAQLKQVGLKLGDARNWDVFLLEINKMRQSSHSARSVESILPELLAQRAQSHTHVQNMLASVAYSRLLLQLGKWLEEKAWRNRLGHKGLHRIEQAITKFAAQSLAKHAADVKLAGEQFGDMDALQRHALRILVKKLNYACRFFAALYPKKETLIYIGLLGALQDCLGLMNDVGVAHELLEQANVREETLARQFINGWNAQLLQAELLKSHQLWQQFLQQPVFWE